jgi:hypothetical protein
MMKRLFEHHKNISTLAVATALMLSIGAWAQKGSIKTVTAEGEAAVINGDKDKAIEDAKRSARRRAIEKGVGTVVTSNTIVRNYQLLSDEIVTSARGILVSEQWGDPKVADGVAKINLTAKVTPDPAAALENAICTVVKANKDPKVALLMVERMGTAEDPYKEKTAERGAIESKFARAFMDACFTLVEPGVKVTVENAAGDVDQKVMERIIQNTGAQYIVRGKADIVLAANKFFGSKFKSYQVSANLTMYSAETNSIVATANASRMIPAMAGKNVLNNVVKRGSKEKVFDKYILNKIMDDLFSQVAKDWSAQATGSSRVTVQIKGVKKFADANAFKKVAQKTFGKGEVTRRSLRKGVAIFDVKVDGGADEFASKMEGKKAGRYTIEILEVTTGKVVMQLK